MKKNFFLTGLTLLAILTACGKNNVNKISYEESPPSIDISEDIDLDTYSGFASDGQFELSIIDTSIRKFEDIDDTKIIDNIKDKAKGKYVIYIDFIFEDKTIDTDFSYSSYKLQDLLPKAKNMDKKDLELVSATNIVPGLEGLKSNEESVRAIFVSDKKEKNIDYSFKITDKLDKENKFKIRLQPSEE
ncbi:MAG: hypothetical protein SOW41_00495 [Anaerococcus sp.]|nr:hypothetical protein [Peptoniphilaceae bacterium]MDY3054519.1 hypothetical protein [Anaerococcus sp.]